MPIALEELSLTDRWMLSRLAATTSAINSALASYLFSPMAAYVPGAVIPIDGGVTAGLSIST